MLCLTLVFVNGRSLDMSQKQTSYPLSRARHESGKNVALLLAPTRVFYSFPCPKKFS